MGSVRRFKRIYVEITNVCNLKCSFCQPTLRSPRHMTVAGFEHICRQIQPFTDYIYLHVKGEPLLHPDFAKILEIAQSYGLKVNITTNGTLLKKQLDAILSYPPHQINMSFHSAGDNVTVDFDRYVRELFEAIRTIHSQTDTQMSLRLWASHGKLDMFGLSNIKILDRLHINIASEFDWPDLSGSYYEEKGTCLGLKSHVAILCDGTVVPCCLDGNGIIALGNVLDTDFSRIINSERAARITKEFSSHRKACEELCRHCSYKERFTRTK